MSASGPRVLISCHDARPAEGVWYCSTIFFHPAESDVDVADSVVGSKSFVIFLSKKNEETFVSRAIHYDKKMRVQWLAHCSGTDFFTREIPVCDFLILAEVVSGQNG